MARADALHELRGLQVYRDLDIPESKRESLPRSTSHKAETNGASRPGSAHLDGPTNGKSELDPVVLGCHLVEFWTNICLCQSLIVEEAEDDGPPIYQVRHAPGDVSAPSSWHSREACWACLLAMHCCPLQPQTFAVTDQDASLTCTCLSRLQFIAMRIACRKRRSKSFSHGSAVLFMCRAHLQMKLRLSKVDGS